MDLPSNYGVTRVTLIARDPYSLHAYWEIAQSSIDDAQAKLGDGFSSSVVVLRMYDVTCVDFNGSNANNTFDIDVGWHTSSWYLSLWCDNVSYVADLGIRGPNGEFITLARANTITAPRREASGRSDVIWMQVPQAHGGAQGAAKQAELSKKKTTTTPDERKRRRYYLTEDDVRAYYSNLFPLLKQVISARPGSRKRKLAPKAGPKVFYDGEWLSQDSLVKTLQGQVIKKLRTGSSEELAGASEINQAASEQPQKGRQFYFELNTELIVYGRTEPGATVMHGEKKVEVKPDGTFSLRFALPDATTIPLDFTATSSDRQESRNIKTGVERYKTEYHP
jgi:uncharacterized protein